MMLAGGSDAALVPLTFHSQANYGMLQAVEDPRRAIMPFDANRNRHRRRRGLGDGDARTW